MAYIVRGAAGRGSGMETTPIGGPPNRFGEPARLTHRACSLGFQLALQQGIE
jgi:hypothetical protein